MNRSVILLVFICFLHLNNFLLVRPEEQLSVFLDKQDCVSSSPISCDFNAILKTQNLLVNKTLNEKDIFSFLVSIDSNCMNNVEYTELFNEVLWKCIAFNPEKSLFAFTSNINMQKRKLIIDMMEHPIHDGLNLNIQISPSIKSHIKDTVAFKQFMQAIATAKSTYE